MSAFPTARRSPSLRDAAFPKRPRRSGGRAGGVPTWVPMLLLAIGFLFVLDKLQESAKEKGVGRVDASRYRLHTGPLYFGDAWRNRLESILRRAQSIELSDQTAIAAIRAELGALSFVEQVGEPEVLWPDGIVFPLQLREPAACVPVGADYLPVSDDGVVMAGYSYGPHEVYGAWLPILGPAQRSQRAGPPAPGDRITDEALLAALQVARSMQRHLTPDQQRLLGRIVIDASSDQAPDGLPGGVVIDLEGKRRIVFGRPPGSGEPGELAVATKWQSVLSALEGGDQAPVWDLLDVRWDQPVMHLRDRDGDDS